MGIRPLVSAWVKGYRVRCRPVEDSPPPPLDLSAVLVALTEEFEPLSRVDMKALTYKVLFLVTLASARRISELHGLSGEPPVLIERAHFNLAVNAAIWLSPFGCQCSLSSENDHGSGLVRGC